MKSVREMKRPASKSELESFLGLVSYYRRFANNLADVERPLRDLCKQYKFEWNKQCEAAFNEIKQIISSDIVLAYPDPWRQFLFDTDASDKGLGAVLSQIDG